jgi:inhibitor of KinA
MRIVPLGDQALLVYLPDEATAVRLAAAVRAANPPWLEDVVPAYASVGVFFDAERVTAGAVSAWLAAGPYDNAPTDPGRPPRSFTIPVCYEFAPDLPRVCDQTGLRPEEVIALHTASRYTVHAVGFVPGFPYLGYLPPGLCGVGRLPSPRLRVEPGSVGITGRQTAVYPQATPGGWNLIGRTPLVIVDVADGFFPLRVGDTVRFTRIDEREYRQRQGQRLQPVGSVGGEGGPGAGSAARGSGPGASFLT